MKASLLVLASGLAAATAVGSGPARVSDGGPADGPDGWEAAPTAQAPAPVMRAEAPDLPPADWDDDARQHGYAAAGYAQAAYPQQPPTGPAQWVTSDVGRHWAASDLEAGAASVAQGASQAQVSYAMTRQAVATGNISHTYHIDPHLLADMPDANSVCGTADQIHDCGFSWLAPVCTDASSSDCVRGVCICTSEGGCDKPTCEASPFECHSHKPLPLAACKGGSCLTKHGSGWSCWHPCNMQHEIEDYGAQADRVKAIRATGVCGNIMETNKGGNQQAEADPELLKDIPHASGFCGSQDMVRTCGYSHLEDVCTGPDCYKGVCVCTAPGGCLQPQCKAYPSKCPMGLAQCNGGSCLAVPGTGWSCWHPCNLEHSVEEFGHQAGIVQAIRNSGNCTRIGVHVPGATLRPLTIASEQSGHLGLSTPAPEEGEHVSEENETSGFREDDETPGLDAGIQLRSSSWPLIPAGESTVNAGGSSRRRADMRNQPHHDSAQEIKEVSDSWHRLMQGRVKFSDSGRKALYSLVFVSLIGVAGMVYLQTRKKKEPEASG